mmetsp:Transcript_26320/g.84219  ORF Transcript_26320/g.84219 Transcript_26320/m.84219 type:complete len:115 (-) Transcript_26320:869-1213(-)
MADELDELIEFLADPRAEAKKMAAEIVEGLTGAPWPAASSQPPRGSSRPRYHLLVHPVFLGPHAERAHGTVPWIPPLPPHAALPNSLLTCAKPLTAALRTWLLPLVLCRDPGRD